MTNNSDGSEGGRTAASGPPTPLVNLEEEDEFLSTEEEEEQEGAGDEGEEEGADAEGDGAPDREEEAESFEQAELRIALERLESMCSVLGVDFKKKMLEMGVMSADDLDITRVYNQMDHLQVTIDANYDKFKVTGKELMKEWELCDTPFKRMMTYAHVISVSDSLTSKDVIDAQFLSTLWLKKAQDEVKRLQMERKKAEKKEYETQRDRLKYMILENHLTMDVVGFDLKRKVNPDKYPEEAFEIRKKIEKAKQLSVGRKEVVFRIELVKQLIEQKKLAPHIIRGLLASAKKHVDMITEGQRIMYDGDDVNAALDKLKQEIDTFEDDEKKEEDKKLRMQRLRTRNARSPSN